MNFLQRVWNCSSLSISTKVHLYEPSTDKVCSPLRYRNIDPLGHRHEYTGGFPRKVSATETLDVCWWAHISNAEVLQRSGLSAISDILRHRRVSLFGHVARLDPGASAHDALCLMVDTYDMKAESQWPAGEDRRVALATSGSIRSRRMSTLYRYQRCGDLSYSWADVGE